MVPAFASKPWSMAGNIQIDDEGRSSIYVPITQDGKVVDSQGYMLDLEDE
jgi:hypothetical protein